MATRVAKAMLYIMKLTYEAVGVVVANFGQGLITINDFAKLNEKSVEGLCWVLRRNRGTTRGKCLILGLQFQLWLRQTYKG